MKVLPYTDDNLAKALSNKYTSPAVIKTKNHFLYFKDYFGNSEMEAKTIVVEDSYISKDFINDYASYYAFCFEHYPKTCKRVHFFSDEFNKDELKKAIIDTSKKSEIIWKNYLGFVVVKPIPIKNIGYTVLKTYKNSTNLDDRNFWGVRSYKVHVFGKEIEIQSLAFQEQDSVLSACATTAIWSMLNKASLDFHTIMKSPSEITKDADNKSYDGSRLFPNKGLDIYQICQAIQNSGLVCEIKTPDITLVLKDHEEDEEIEDEEIEDEEIAVVSNQRIKKILNAYAPIGIPLILIISVPNHNQYGLHAITVSGYKKNKPINIPVKNTETTWISDNIEKFYAHDDQWGPFARINFVDNDQIETPWTIFNPDKNPTFVKNIIVPVFPKIRISYEDVESIVLGLDTILSLFFDELSISDLAWDIKIEFSENIKKDIKDSNLDDIEKVNFLIKNYPKYLWTASCYIEEKKIFDFIFDATDISAGMLGKDVICYVKGIKGLLYSFLKANETQFKSLLANHSESVYYDFLLKHLES